MKITSNGLKASEGMWLTEADENIVFPERSYFKNIVTNRPAESFRDATQEEKEAYDKLYDEEIKKRLIEDGLVEQELNEPIEETIG